MSILIIFCGCSAQKEVTSLELPGGPAAPQESLDLNAVPSAPTVEIDTTQKETDNETYYLERQRLSLPEPLLSVTAQTVLDDTILVGGFSTDGVALAWMTLEGDSGTLQLIARNTSMRFLRMTMAASGFFAEAYPPPIGTLLETS